MKNGKIKRYSELSNKYIKDAGVLMEKGDLSEASGKLWGAFATIVKAIAAKRNKNIKTHDGISFYVASISKELKDESLLNASLSANALHQNFYENTLTQDHIKKGAKTIRLFINRMKGRFSLN